MLWPQVPQILAVCDRHSQGGGAGERGQDVYGEQENKVREAGFPMQWEVGELGNVMQH